MTTDSIVRPDWDNHTLEIGFAIPSFDGNVASESQKYWFHLTKDEVVKLLTQITENLVYLN